MPAILFTFICMFMYSKKSCCKRWLVKVYTRRIHVNMLPNALCECIFFSFFHYVVYIYEEQCATIKTCWLCWKLNSLYVPLHRVIFWKTCLWNWQCIFMCICKKLRVFFFASEGKFSKMNRNSDWLVDVDFLLIFSKKGVIGWALAYIYL